MMQKPDVDSIEGLSPAISIEQKTTSKNPRSTVGTTTEIDDYLRLLFARIWNAVPPRAQYPDCRPEPGTDRRPDRCGAPWDGHGPRADSPSEERDLPAAPQRPEQGRLRPVRVNKKIIRTDEEVTLDRTKKQDIEIVIDRLKPTGPACRSRREHAQKVRWARARGR